MSELYGLHTANVKKFLEEFVDLLEFSEHTTQSGHRGVQWLYHHMAGWNASAVQLRNAANEPSLLKGPVTDDERSQ